MFHRIPLRRSPGIMGHRNRQAGLIGQTLQLAFPKTHAATIAATTVSQDQQSLPRAVRASAASFPPVAYRIDSQLRGVLAGGDADVALIATNVVDSIRHGAAVSITGKI